ncbi:MAG: sigma-70 family RNA polymerase sigma factor [Hyphomicrobium sp.]|jgi:RNA polymerase sigma-70 factor (ECF subfamily)|nr:sigma-70 family RNA polymerase sigma factor [Hyphomicrobium sp.]
MSGQFQDDLAALVPNLRAFAKSLSGNADYADDLVQETLIKAWKNRNTFAEGSNLKAWLFTILRNTFLSDRRKRKFEVEDPDGILSAKLSTHGEQSGHMDFLDFAQAFGKLPDDQREALILIGAEGFSYEEAALMCGCAVGTIKSRVNRARNKLVEMLDMKEQGVAEDDESQPPSSPRPLTTIF